MNILLYILATIGAFSTIAFFIGIIGWLETVRKRGENGG